MPITVRWFDDEKQLIYQEYQGSLTIEALKVTANESHELAITVSHPVDILMQFKESNLADFRRVMEISAYIESKVPPNQRFVYMINTPSPIKTIVTVVRRFTPRAGGNTSFVDTLEEALLLREQQLKQIAQGEQPLMRLL
jgi:hypothetical protein